MKKQLECCGLCGSTKVCRHEPPCLHHQNIFTTLPSHQDTKQGWELEDEKWQDDIKVLLADPDCHDMLLGVIKSLLTTAHNEGREEVMKEKDSIYHERDCVVAALSKCFPSYLAQHPKEDTEWEHDWRTIVFIELPTGQVSWHIHDNERWLFKHLPFKKGNGWDGHTTKEKYNRLNRLSPNKGK